MSDRTFAPIGPFDLSRSDQLVAANVLGFVLGSRKAKAWTYFLLIGSVVIAIGSAIEGDGGGVLAALLFIGLLFIIAPLLRSNARSRAVVISEDAEGLAIETAAVRTVYKWNRLGRAQIVANRLFVMIDGNCGLVIPGRATTQENLNAAVATIEGRRLAQPPA